MSNHPSERASSNPSVSSSCTVLIIGAGSAGIAFARRARQHLPKARIVLVDRDVFTLHVGGTCVNRGCVPKKLFWTEARHAMTLRSSNHMKYFNGNFKNDHMTFNWSQFKADLDNYLVKLRNRYIAGLEQDSIEMLSGEVIEVSPGDQGILLTIKQDSKRTIKCEQLVIATGSTPAIPSKVPGGVAYGITSDNIFDDNLERGLGESMAIIGSGYVAVEMAGILTALGIKVELFIRSSALLNTFDTMIQEEVARVLKLKGIVIHPCINVTEIIKDKQGMLTIKADHLTEEPGCNSSTLQPVHHGPFNRIMWAIGRNGQLYFKHPLDLTLDHRFLETENAVSEQGASLWRCMINGTPLPHVHAIGDVTGKHMLTPHAIAIGRRLADDLYAPKVIMSPLRVVPSVLFTDPPAGTCGMTETHAVDKYGAARIKVYQTRFKPLSIALHDDDAEGDVAHSHPSTCHYKLICLISDEPQAAIGSEIVIGVHIVGPDSDEALQGFAVAMQMGVTRADLLSTCALHPTLIEELLTIKERKSHG